MLVVEVNEVKIKVLEMLVVQCRIIICRIMSVLVLCGPSSVDLWRSRGGVVWEIYML